MSQPLVYVDVSEVRGGKLPQLKAAVEEPAEFVAENEPQLVSYCVYFTEDGSRMTDRCANQAVVDADAVRIAQVRLPLLQSQE